MEVHKKKKTLFPFPAPGRKMGRRQEREKNLVYPWPRPRETSCLFQDLVLKYFGVNLQIQSHRARAGL